MDRLGLGAQAVLAKHPAIVYASVSGFGWTPAGIDRRGVDLIVQAESGMMSVTGYPDGPPTKVGFTVVDAACGHALCHGILAALFRRTRTGRGAHVRISLHDVALNIQAGPLAEYMATRTLPVRAGNSAPHTAPSDLFECADGHVIVTAYLDPHWAKLVGLLASPELATDPRFATSSLRVKHRGELYRILSELLRAQPTAHWIAELSRAGLLIAKVRTYDEVVSSDITRESGLLLDLGGSYGVRSPVELVDTKPIEAHALRFTTPTHIKF
jgi:crotonobetainyl-CoA:carnitine CoA-transferase CaiB-like acyl-CoA transferase